MSAKYFWADAIAAIIVLGFFTLFFGPLSAGELFGCAAVMLAINIIHKALEEKP
jgi:hypothetical protein